MPESSKEEVAQFSREQFEKGMAAFHRENYDYAIELFNGVLKLEPGFYEARKALRATQFKRVQERKGLFRKVLGKASASTVMAKAQLTARRKPEEALAAAEQVLNSDPDNAFAHRVLADAARHADLPRTALLSLEILYRQNSTDKKVVLQLADAYANVGQIQKAESLYSEVIKANPNDPELQQALKDLSALRTLVEGGYEKLEGGKGSYRDILRDRDEAMSLEQEKRVVKSEDVANRLIEENEKRLEEEPQNRNVLKTLADLQLQKHDYSKALEYLKRMQEAGGEHDPALAKSITQTSLKMMDRDLESLDPSAPDYDARRQELLGKKMQFQIEDCQERVKRYPTDLHIRFELGELYFKAGMISEAIGEFQKAQTNPNRKVAALGYLGQCFAKRGLKDVAVRTLEKAIESSTVFNEEKKELIYQLGCVLDDMGRSEEAIEYFKQIYEVDIGYRDVAARVDAYYSVQ